MLGLQSSLAHATWLVRGGTATLYAAAVIATDNLKKEPYPGQRGPGVRMEGQKDTRKKLYAP